MERMKKDMNLQKAALLAVAVISTAMCFFSGCGQGNDTNQQSSEETTVAQAVYDQGVAVKAYTDKTFHNFLNTMDSDYTIVKTACGFVTDEESYYVVRYQCNNGVNDFFYGYKIRVDENHNCTIVAEGETTAQTLLG